MVNLEQIIESVILSRALYASCCLNIAEKLDDNTLDIKKLGEALDCDIDALQRLMRYLLLNDIFKINSKGEYQHSEFSSTMSSAHPDTIKPFLLHEDETRWNTIGNLQYSIKTGKPSFDHLYNKDYFSYIKEHKLLSTRFNDAMRIISKREEEIIAKEIRFTNTIVDIGGGTGQLINKINKYNTVKKLYLFELPEVKENFTAANCIKISGSFFDKIEAKANIYILKRILHDWNDKQALMILKNVTDAMSIDSRLLIFEGVIDQENAKYLSAIDLLLLSIFGGKERTLDGFNQLIQSSGLRIESVKLLTETMSCIECRKNG